MNEDKKIIDELNEATGVVEVEKTSQPKKEKKIFPKQAPLVLKHPAAKKANESAEDWRKRKNRMKRQRKQS